MLNEILKCVSHRRTVAARTAKMFIYRELVSEIFLFLFVLYLIFGIKIPIEESNI